MSRTVTALFTGLILGLTAAFGDFSSFVIVLVFGVVGMLVGMVLDGKIDVPALIGRAAEKR